MATFFENLLNYTFYYPLFMSFIWMIGAIYYFFYREGYEKQRHNEPPELSEYPGVTYIVPCHNEGENVRETIESLLNQNYPEFEVIAINDASKDNTGEVLTKIAASDDRVRTIHLETNQGKAMGLRVGTLAAKNEFLICIDGDAILDSSATRWLMRHFVSGARVGAVTGNPRVRNRTTLLGKIQVGEFSSIIGIIKRAQRIYGRVFTISGVVAAFRRSAVHKVGYWGLDIVTEDIDISWRLQLDHWDIRYEPNALCWILMPETLKGLWQQRLRWAQGGVEVIKHHWRKLFNWKSRRMWIVALELIASTAWAYAMGTVLMIWLLGLFFVLNPPYIASFPPGWTGVILGTTCLVQFAVSILIDNRYETRLGRVYYWMIWYPMVYWMIQMFTSIIAVPKALLKKPGSRAIWTSPDRGVRPRG